MIKRWKFVFTAGLVASAGACSSTSPSTSSTSTSPGAGTIQIDAATCQSVCARIGVPRCPKEDPSTCEASCSKLGSVIPAACSTEGNAFVKCASNAQTWSCDGAGYAAPSGCDASSSALGACLEKNGGSSGGGGISGGSGGGGGSCEAAGGKPTPLTGCALKCDTSDCGGGPSSDTGYKCGCPSGFSCNPTYAWCDSDTATKCAICARAK